MISIADVLDRAIAGGRISRQEGLMLLERGELLDLADAANAVRFRLHPKREVTFLVDTNPNYSNLCTIDCIFCAFYRHPGEEGAYTHSVDDLIKKFKDAAVKGVTTVLLQGGVHPSLPFEYYLELVERTIREVPEVYPHFFSTSEIIGMANIAGLSIPEVLRRLWDAGLRSIPGGGAEILSDRVKQKISHLKGTSADWLNVMREAHKIGYKSTATMMYGHLEKDEDIIEHLDAVRSLQDELHGFTAFVPWSFKPGNTPLEKIIPRYASPIRYLQIIALSRLYLDNVPHIQASWFSEGKKTGQIALHFGADDFGGTLQEENVHAAANFVNKTNTEECIQLIHDSGFAATQRTTLYDILKVFPLPAAAA
ncbi:MAG TPA: cyclic dehypoxanthinyl futalosine synthase [Bacteroidota bacterium]|nr:cyclic dehypoxanthinyl futalosine synthase [Bacteroidota bacterium]